MNTVWIVFRTSDYNCCSIVDSIWSTETAAKTREQQLDIQKVHCWIEDFNIQE